MPLNSNSSRQVQNAFIIYFSNNGLIILVICFSHVGKLGVLLLDFWGTRVLTRWSGPADGLAA